MLPRNCLVFQSYAGVAPNLATGRLKILLIVSI